MTKYMIRMILIYFFLVAIPLIPILVLYLLFGKMNYFGLEGWVKGLVASGPIAAYLFMLHVGYRMFTNLMNQVYPFEIAEIEKFVGIWQFKSTTLQSGKNASGRMVASLSHGQLAFSGTLYGEEDKAFGGAEKAFGETISEFCHVDPERRLFRMLYRAQTLDKEAKLTPQDCLCYLVVEYDQSKPTKMTGHWLQITDGDFNGNITFVRDDS